jgi:DNA-binding transcriptional LysR family regulator
VYTDAELKKSQTEISTAQKEKSDISGRLQETNLELEQAKGDLATTSQAEKEVRDQLTAAQESLQIIQSSGAGDQKAALALQGEIRQLKKALEAAETVLQAAPRFDPARAERSFVLAMADQAAFQLLPPLVQRLAAAAPGITLQLRPPPADLAAALSEGEFELAIGVFGDSPSGIRSELLWTETFACVVRRGGPGTRGPFDLRRYLARPHLLVAPRGRPGSIVDDLLARDHLRRRVAVVVPHFLVAPAIIAASDLVWTAPAGLAHALAARYALTVRPPPLAIPSFAIAMRWHLRLDRDPGLAWLRSLLREVAPS